MGNQQKYQIICNKTQTNETYLHMENKSVGAWLGDYAQD